jgi:hypothetical protein
MPTQMASQRKDDDNKLYGPQAQRYPGFRTPPANPFVEKMASTVVITPVFGTPGAIVETDAPEYPPHSPHPPWMTGDENDGSWTSPTSRTTSETWVTMTRPTSSPDGSPTSLIATLSLPIETLKVSPSPNVFTSIVRYNWRHPGQHGSKEKTNSGGLIAAATITPIVILVAIGGLVYFYMWKRKRQQRAAVIAAQHKVDKMKMQSSSTSQFTIAPPQIVSRQYHASHHQYLPPANPAVPHPIILGPIPSGANGAYFTGIDTSDMISMTSANYLRPPNQFSDNDSVIEPPPPYRPRSTAPPSLTNTSRHSSFRASSVPPATSQTHLIERAPFEDPVNDDTVSELSGPTTRHGDDTMSAVSDLSYQQDPVVNMSSL